MITMPAVGVVHVSALDSLDTSGSYASPHAVGRMQSIEFRPAGGGQCSGNPVFAK